MKFLQAAIIYSVQIMAIFGLLQLMYCSASFITYLYFVKGMA